MMEEFGDWDKNSSLPFSLEGIVVDMVPPGASILGFR
jgi:hypothetical protein